MKNKKSIYENITVYDTRRIFFVCSAVDGHTISEEARTLGEAIDEALKLYSKGVLGYVVVRRWLGNN